MKVGIVGSGSWGTALGSVVARSCPWEIALYVRDDDLVNPINLDHINPRYFGNHLLPENLIASCDLSYIVDSDFILLVVPVFALRSVLIEVLSCGIRSDIPFLVCSKGIDVDTLLFPLETVASLLADNPIAFLAGPNFAGEILRKRHACASFAVSDKDRECFGALIDVINLCIKLYLTNDLMGVQVYAAVKNVIAIAGGILDGLGAGYNAKAALMCNGLKSMVRLSKLLGGRLETVLEPCGTGDLILTCSSVDSRNYSFGKFLANGSKIDPSEAATVEGKYTLKALKKLLLNRRLEIELLDNVYSIVYGGAPASSLLEVVF